MRIIRGPWEIVFYNTIAISSFWVYICFYWSDTWRWAGCFVYILTWAWIIVSLKKLSLSCWNREHILLHIFTSNFFVWMFSFILAWSSFISFLWQVIKLIWTNHIIKRFSRCSETRHIHGFIHCVRWDLNIRWWSRSRLKLESLIHIIYFLLLVLKHSRDIVGERTWRDNLMPINLHKNIVQLLRLSNFPHWFFKGGDFVISITFEIAIVGVWTWVSSFIKGFESRLFVEWVVHFSKGIVWGVVKYVGTTCYQNRHLFNCCFLILNKNKMLGINKIKKLNRNYMFVLRKNDLE